ncbi:MAG TPA: isoprenylcysteine carboxylmethyltransferase family protein [Lacipirellula sp.]
MIAMKRWMFFAYGLVCYMLFFAVYAYFCGFTGNLLVPKSIDAPFQPAGATAFVVNVALLLAFGWSHSLMARPGFKRRWTRLVPQPIERSTYVLTSCIMLALLMWQWQPMPAVVWSFESQAGRALMWALFATGWLMVPAVSLMISHFDLFGMRQVWLYLVGRPYEWLPFRTPMLYSRVRHPLYIGWGLAFWAAPTMTAGHLLFASVLTVYMGLATLVEERDLIAHFGEQYLLYRRSVPRFIPRLRPVEMAHATTRLTDEETAAVEPAG